MPIIDKDVESEIDEMVGEEITLVNPQPLFAKPSIKVNTVNLDAVIKFERQKETRESEDSKNGKETETESVSVSTSRDTPVSRKRKRWYDTIY